MCNWIKSGENRVDPCLVETIKRLQEYGIAMVASCCGHGRYPATVLFKDSQGVIRDLRTMIVIPRKKRFYKRDSEGQLFIPEVPLIFPDKT